VQVEDQFSELDLGKTLGHCLDRGAFSVTNNTLCPAAATDAMTLAMVWLFQFRAGPE